jgi:hypothetical protein
MQIILETCLDLLSMLHVCGVAAIIFLDQGYRDRYGSKWQGIISRKRSHHLVLWSLENLTVYKSLNKGTSGARERRVTPSAPYLPK